MAAVVLAADAGAGGNGGVGVLLALADRIVFQTAQGAGLHLEHWQQETALALSKRLLVAAMACVLVWRVRRSKSAEAGVLRELLVRLSGRQMKWGVQCTEPALLAGLWSLLQTLHLLEHYDPQELRQLLRTALHPPDPPNTPPSDV